MRPLGVPAVADRALQRSATQVLSAIYMSRTSVLFAPADLRGGKKDRQQVTGILMKVRESARVLQWALVLRQLDQGTAGDAGGQQYEHGCGDGPSDCPML